MKFIHKNIGIRIRQHRNHLGLSQEKLALNAGLTVSFLGDIERCQKNPTVESLEKILNALQISFRDFFDFEADIKPLQSCTALEKLVIDLQNRPHDEIEMIYLIVKKIIEYNDSMK
jgi:transcriptional regulator with XRE-family HTH domain